MKVRVFLALALVPLFAQPAAGRPPAAKTNASLTALSHALLAQAPSNFAALRLAKTGYDTDYASYKMKLAAAICRTCALYDQYARGAYKETWYVENRWNVPASWTPARTEGWILGQLRPVLSGFALHRTVARYSTYPTLLWRGPHSVWIYADTFKGGFRFRVGHDLAHPVHVLRPPTRAQLTELARASSNLIRLSVPAASSNFDDLRSATGRNNELGDLDYATNVPFGPMFRTCSISHVTNSFGYKDFQPKWVLSCSTVAMAATDAALKERVRASVAGALPSGFTPTTDQDELLFDDYRWDDDDLMESVDVGSDERKGTVRFTLSVYHFLPKEPVN